MHRFLFTQRYQNYTFESLNTYTFHSLFPELKDLHYLKPCRGLRLVSVTEVPGRTETGFLSAV